MAVSFSIQHPGGLPFNPVCNLFCGELSMFPLSLDRVKKELLHV